MQRLNPLQRAFIKEDQKTTESDKPKTDPFIKPQLLNVAKPSAFKAPGIARQPGCSTLPVSGGIAASTDAQSTGKRNKVVLKPGCGPLDWADLQAKRGVSGELVIGALISIHDWDTFKKDNEVYEQNLIPVLMDLAEKFPHRNLTRQDLLKYPPILPWDLKPALKIRMDEVKRHNTVEDMWCVLDGKVYSLSKYLQFHPGGDEILIQYCAGKSATVMFNKYHRWVNYEKLLQTFYIGDLKK